MYGHHHNRQDSWRRSVASPGANAPSSSSRILPNINEVERRLEEVRSRERRVASKESRLGEKEEQMNYRERKMTEREGSVKEKEYAVRRERERVEKLSCEIMTDKKEAEKKLKTLVEKERILEEWKSKLVKREQAVANIEEEKKRMQSSIDDYSVDQLHYFNLASKYRQEAVELEAAIPLIHESYGMKIDGYIQTIESRDTSLCAATAKINELQSTLADNVLKMRRYEGSIKEEEDTEEEKKDEDDYGEPQKKRARIDETSRYGRLASIVPAMSGFMGAVFPTVVAPFFKSSLTYRALLG